MNHLRCVFQLSLRHLEPSPHPLNLIIRILNLLLNRSKLLVDIEPHFFLCLQVLFHEKLLSPAFLELGGCLKQLLLLFHDLLHSFVTLKELFLHVLDLAEDLGLLGLLLLRLILLLLKLFEQLATILLRDLHLGVDDCTLFGELLHYLLLLSLKLVFHLFHPFFVFNEDVLFDFNNHRLAI